MTDQYANMQRRHIARSYDAIFRHAAIEVAYQAHEHGDDEEQAVTIDAVNCAPASGTSAVGHAVTEHHGEQWLVRDEQLRAAIDRDGAEPQRGDRIIELIDGGARKLIHELTPPSAGEPPWRWSDPGRTVRRLFTKQIHEETES